MSEAEATILAALIGLTAAILLQILKGFLEHFEAKRKEHRAVSYTHLDVYKRQVSTPGDRRSAQCAATDPPQLGRGSPQHGPGASSCPAASYSSAYSAWCDCRRKPGVSDCHEGAASNLAAGTDWLQNPGNQDLVSCVRSLLRPGRRTCPADCAALLTANGPVYVARRTPKRIT